MTENYSGEHARRQVFASADMGDISTSTKKQELHNRVDIIANEFIRHLKKLIESMKLDSGNNLKRYILKYPVQNVYIFENLDINFDLKSGTWLGNEVFLSFVYSAITMSSSMGCLEAAREYLQLIQELKNDVLLADVSQIKKE